MGDTGIPGDTNVNYPTLNGQVPTGKVDRASFNQNFGYDQARDNYNFISGGNIYRMQNGNISQIDTVANRQALAAQQQYQAQAGSAVAGLQTGKANLGQQYADLLKTVTGEYQPLINQTTASAGAEEARRGLSPDSFLAQQQVQGALQPVYGAEAANAQQIGAGSIADVNTYNQAIASLQSGQAQFGATLPLQYGSLSVAQQLLPSQQAFNLGQANYYGGRNPTELQTAALGANKPFGVGNLVFNPSSNSFSIPRGGGKGGGETASAATYALRTIAGNRKASRPSMTQITNYAQ